MSDGGRDILNLIRGGCYLHFGSRLLGERERNAHLEEREKELLLAMDLGERGRNTYKA